MGSVDQCGSVQNCPEQSVLLMPVTTNDFGAFHTRIPLELLDVTSRRSTLLVQYTNTNVDTIQGPVIGKASVSFTHLPHFYTLNLMVIVMTMTSHPIQCTPSRVYTQLCSP